MRTHFDLSDTELETAFENCTLDPGLFSHEAHLRLAWIYIKQFEVDEAVDRICFHLARFVTYIGEEDKYNLTLTIAATHAVNHFMNKSKSGNFKDFILEFPRLKNNFRELIETHYGFDIFSNQEAKKTFLEPDLIPFD